MPAVKRKAPKFIAFMREHFGRVCYIHGRLCDGAMRGETEFHHEPAKSQAGSADFKGRMMCQPAHTGPKGRHTVGLKIYAPLMTDERGEPVEVVHDDEGEMIKPDAKDIKDWCDRESRIYWGLFLRYHDFHGPIPEKEEKMWEILETLGMAQVYVPRKSKMGSRKIPTKGKQSKRGPIKKWPDYDAIYNPEQPASEVPDPQSKRK